jgi:poly-beta-1,6-N-acetyl-D-glucosamine N-deacetylase
MISPRPAIWLIVLALALIAPAAASPPAPGGKLQPPAQPMRALQVMNLDCATPAELDLRLAGFKKAGAQAVILRVFHYPGDPYYPFIRPAAKSGVYFKTAAAPVVGDALGLVCERAHQQGLRVIAWMTTRNVELAGAIEPGLRCQEYDFGRKKIVPGRGLSVLLPEVQDRLITVYRDLGRYPIDGVLLQDDLMLRHHEDFNPAVIERYRQATGRTAAPARFFRNPHRTRSGWLAVGYTPEFEAWRRWQNRELLALAERLRAAVQAGRPGVPVGLNLYYETLTRPQYALEWYAQDLDATLASGLDYYALMLYHRQMEQEMRLTRTRTFDLITAALGRLVSRVDCPQRIWVKVQAVDWNTGDAIPSSELSELLRRARGQGQVGLVITPATRGLDLKAVSENFKP